MTGSRLPAGSANDSPTPLAPTERRLSNGEYEAHKIGVNWPHHIFVNKDFKVVGAD